MKRASSERMCAPSVFPVAWVVVPKGATKKRPTATQGFFPELGKFVGIDFSVRTVHNELLCKDSIGATRARPR